MHNDGWLLDFSLTLLVFITVAVSVFASLAVGESGPLSVPFFSCVPSAVSLGMWKRGSSC